MLFLHFLGNSCYHWNAMIENISGFQTVTFSNAGIPETGGGPMTSCD